MYNNEFGRAFNRYERFSRFRKQISLFRVAGGLPKSRSMMGGVTVTNETLEEFTLAL